MSAAKKLRDPAAAVARAREKPAPASTPGPRYADRIKVYPQRIDGRFRRIKWAILAFCLTVYYVAPWLRWDRGPNAPGQALLIDLPVRRAYFFGLEIWPQEVYFLTGLLIIAAIGLFLATSLLGRVWCGYACPQTVWTDLFMMVERLIEGDRNARMRLDKAPFGAAKAAKKLAKHAAWLLIAAATGGAWVLYFQDAPTALREILTGGASAQTYFFVGLFTTTTYLLAGWAREQVCTYMCPWPRFQSAMLDENTFIVTYEAWRGEPRGHGKRQGVGTSLLGDCVDCKACVHVCPTGIDIRDGVQLECIGCGLCIDACNHVMAKTGSKPWLITWDSLARQKDRAEGRPPSVRLIRPRVLIYLGVLLIGAGVLVAGLMMRSHIGLSVAHDRAPLFVRLENGDLRNGYTVLLINKDRKPAEFRLSVTSFPSARLVLPETSSTPQKVLTLTMPPDTVQSVRVLVQGQPDHLEDGREPLDFVLRNTATGEQAVYHSVFMGPHEH